MPVVMTHGIGARMAATAAAFAAAALMMQVAGCGGRSQPDQEGSVSSAAAPQAAPGSFGPAQDLPGLHNVIEAAPGVFSGSEPRGEEAFAELERLGVKAIISVDGGRPDLDVAHARGIRYAHVPIRYSEITLEERLAITRAMRDLDGPIYIHCHHGKHRGPAAAATGLVSLGKLTPDEAVAFMKHAGTSSKYPGLYQCAADSAPLGDGALELVAMPGEVAEVPGFVAAMAQVSRSFENLEAIAAADWTTPPDHPDLAPASEAGQLADVLRVLTERREPEGEEERFYEWMGENARLAQELEDAIVAGEDALSLSARLKTIDASCAACHAVYRNE